MRRPWVGIGVAVAAGMILGSVEIFSIESLIFLALIVLGYTLFSMRKKTGNAGLYIVVALTAATHFSVYRLSSFSEQSGKLFRSLEGKQVELIGYVSDAPEFINYGNRRGGSLRFLIDCEGLNDASVWRKVHRRVGVRVTVQSLAEVVHAGERIRLSGRVRKRVFPAMQSHEIDVAGHWAIHHLSGDRFSMQSWGQTLREAGAVNLESGMDQHSVQEAVLKALVLGYREQMPREIMDIFRRTGAFHIFAISGLHVGIVGLIFAVFLKVAGIPRDKFWMALIPFLAIYVISTGMKSSALRALMMAGIFLVAPVFRRKPDIPTSVAMAALALLLFNPFEILSPGFIFSFIVVIFIVMVYSYVPPNWAQGGWARTYANSLLITSAAASLGSMPLAALYFGMFSPIALLGNLLVVPLTFCIVLCGWLSMLVPFFSVVFNHAALFFINILLSSVSWLDQIPASSWQVSPPPLAAVVLWYGSLILLFTGAYLPRKRRYCMVGAGCAVLLCLLR